MTNTKNKPNKLVTKLRVAIGYVYLAKYTVEGTVYYKIGYTTLNPKKRMTNIAKRNIKKYPDTNFKIRLISSFKTLLPYIVESVIHNYFKPYSIDFDNICAGYTELFKRKIRVLRMFKEVRIACKNNTAVTDYIGPSFIDM